MANRGAQPDNDNAARGKEFKDAMRLAMKRRDRDAVDGRTTMINVADALIDQAEAGEQWAVKEFADRFDGKPAQTQEITGADGGNVIIEIVKQSAISADDSTAE